MPVLVGTEGESMSANAENVERDTTRDNAGLSKEKPKRKKREILPAETGRPETSKEFAARTSKGFVLKGPVERKEGESIPEQQIRASSSQVTGKERLTIRIPAKRDRQKSNQRQQTTTTTTTNTTGISEEQLREEDLSSRARSLDDLFKMMTPITLEELLQGGRDPIDLKETLRNHYHEDPIFKKIVDNPKEFKNYEVTDDGLVYMKIEKGKVLCIPAVKVLARLYSI
ncbi:hypothetical protein H0H92_010285 [Tricholoma furcatifolium]|nr:hypothetical protein H0H92_010285 [Tricholoma furcatifolium]